jgi:hypothetical protein
MVRGKGGLLYDEARGAYLIKEHEGSMAGANIYSAMLPLLRAGEAQASDNSLLNGMAEDHPSMTGLDGMFGSGDELGYGFNFTRTQVEQFVAQNIGETYRDLFAVNRPESSGAAIPSADEYKAAVMALTMQPTISGVMSGFNGGTVTRGQALLTMLNGAAMESFLGDNQVTGAYGMAELITNFGLITSGSLELDRLSALMQTGNSSTSYLQLGSSFLTGIRDGNWAPLEITVGGIALSAFSSIGINSAVRVASSLGYGGWGTKALQIIPSQLSIGYSYAMQAMNSKTNTFGPNYDFDYYRRFYEPSFRRGK